MKPGSRVVFKQPKEPKRTAYSTAEPVEHIPGMWRAIDKSPAGWWLTPASPAARQWVADHSSRVVSGCIEAAGRELETWLPLA